MTPYRIHAEHKAWELYVNIHARNWKVYQTTKFDSVREYALKAMQRAEERFPCLKGATYEDSSH